MGYASQTTCNQILFSKPYDATFSYIQQLDPTPVTKTLLLWKCYYSICGIPAKGKWYFVIRDHKQQDVVKGTKLPNYWNSFSLNSPTSSSNGDNYITLLFSKRPILSKWKSSCWPLRPLDCILPVNQPEKIDQSDSLLSTKVLACKTAFYFKSWLHKWDYNVSLERQS